MPMSKSKISKIARDANGLITNKSIDYIFTEGGLIDWRRMISTEFLVPNRDRTKETDVSKLNDSQLIISF